MRFWSMKKFQSLFTLVDLSTNNPKKSLYKQQLQREDILVISKIKIVISFEQYLLTIVELWLY